MFKKLSDKKAASPKATDKKNSPRAAMAVKADRLSVKTTMAKGKGLKTIVIKGWPEVFIIFFLLIFVAQLVLLIILNLKS